MSVGRPVRVTLFPAAFGEQLTRDAAFRRDDVDFTFGRNVREQDLGAVWRPTGHEDIDRRVAQLYRVASIPVCLPEDTFGEGDIGHRLTVFGEGQSLSGN